MYTSNAKIYNERLKNPSVIEFEYSFKELTALLTFPRPDGFLNLLKDSLLLLFRFLKDLVLYPKFMNQLVNYYYGDAEESVLQKPAKLKHIGYIIKDLSPSVFVQLTKLVEFCNECDIPVLSVSSQSDILNRSFLNVFKVCLEQTKLYHEDFRIEIIHLPSFETTTATNCLRDIEPTLYLILNGPLIEVDVMITQEPSIAKTTGPLLDVPENVKVRFLDELTMKRFLEVVLGAHNLNPEDIERLIAELNCEGSSVEN